MKQTNIFLIILFFASGIVRSQDIFEAGQFPGEEKLKISGELNTDERFLFRDSKDWAWNENRLTIKLEKKITGNSKFYSEVWLRNIGIPGIASSSDLFNKGIVDPYNLEIREAYVQLYGFLSKNLDLTIGRQRIVWGKSDRLNPTDILNPYDLEDLLDFGRHRGSDAINANYYFSNNFSMQGIYIPFFQPANLPVGIFAGAFTSSMDLPQGMTLKEFSDTLLMPEYTLKESSTAGLKLKGSVKGVDFSLGYVWGYDGMPLNTKNTILPVDTLGGISIHSQLSFMRAHTLCGDFATSIAGIGLWGEAACIIPDKEVIMTNDLSAFFPQSPEPVTEDKTVVDKPYIRFLIGSDYFFRDGSYLNIQYLHGFIQERGKENLNDYFFMQYEKKFFNEKLTVAPVGGAFIVSNWDKIKDNYTVVYVPQVSYQATPNSELSLSIAIFDGKGNNLFSGLNDYDMFLINVNYIF